MIDEHAATELRLFIDNDGDLYRRQTTSILKNLATKRARGQYARAGAVKLFGYLVDEGAKKYAKEYGTSDLPWHKMFDSATRKSVAEELAQHFETEAALGYYDRLLPKKYQPSPRVAGSGTRGKTSSHHARKKASETKWKVPEGLAITWSPVNQAYFALWPGKGRIADQHVLKVASADDMHAWLRDTYGEAYGRAGGSRRNHHATIAADDIREFRGFLRRATDRQVQGIYDKEKGAGREEYAELAIAEAQRRGLDLDGGRSAHARRKTPAQLQREIDGFLGRRRR